MNLRSDADAISRLICNMTNSSATKQMFLMLSLTTTVAIIFFLAAAAAGVDAAASPSAASRPSYTGSTSVEVCNRELLNVTCARDEAIYVERAFYGRMSLGRCVKQDLGYLGCEVDVTAYIRAKCAGRPTCNMRVPDDTLHDYKPCPTDTTSYLQLSHRCVPVLIASANECILDKSLRRYITTSGYISSHVSASGGDFGSSRCPWRLHVADGRRLRLTIEVLTMPPPPGSSSSETGAGFSSGAVAGGTGVLHGQQASWSKTGGSRTAGCFDVAIVIEGDKTTRILSCPYAQRVQSEIHVSRGQRETFTSTGNALTVELLLDELRKHSAGLVIKYEGIGCARLALSAGMWARVDGDVAHVHCNTTHETWTVHCQDSRWTGPLGNCSQVPSSKWMLNNILLGENESSFPYGILIAVSVGVALGVFLGGFLLALVSFHLKRRSPPKYEMSTTYERSLRGAQADLLQQQAMTSDQCGDHVVYGQMALAMPDNMVDLVKVGPQPMGPTSSPTKSNFGTLPAGSTMMPGSYSSTPHRHDYPLSPVNSYTTCMGCGSPRLGPGVTGAGSQCHEHCPLTDHYQLADHYTLRSADLSSFNTAKHRPRLL